jgi:PAS domain S-box-containing protein
MSNVRNFAGCRYQKESNELDLAAADHPEWLVLNNSPSRTTKNAHNYLVNRMAYLRSIDDDGQQHRVSRDANKPITIPNSCEVINKQEELQKSDSNIVTAAISPGRCPFSHLKSFSAKVVAENNRQTEYQNEFTFIMHQISEPFIGIDRYDRIISWNIACEKLFGWSSKEIFENNLTLEQTILPDDLQGIHNSYTLSSSNYASDYQSVIGLQRQLSAKKRDGSEFPVSLKIFAFGRGENFKAYAL